MAHLSFFFFFCIAHSTTSAFCRLPLLFLSKRVRLLCRLTFSLFYLMIPGTPFNESCPNSSVPDKSRSRKCREFLPSPDSFSARQTPRRPTAPFLFTRTSPAALPASLAWAPRLLASRVCVCACVCDRPMFFCGPAKAISWEPLMFTRRLKRGCYQPWSRPPPHSHWLYNFAWTHMCMHTHTHTQRPPFELSRTPTPSPERPGRRACLCRQL